MVGWDPNIHTALADSNDVSQFQGKALALVLRYSPRLDLSNEAVKALKGDVERAGGLARHGAGECVQVKANVPPMGTSQAYRILEVHNGHICGEFSV